jgi:hypothetical protein
MKQETTLNRIATMGVALLAATLTACGGGGGSASPGDDGPDPLAADCTPAVSIRYGSTGGIYDVAGARTVVEMEGAAQAVADGAHTIQATALTPGAATFAVYALHGGRCNRAVAETALTPGTPARAARAQASAQDRVFLVLESTAHVLVQVCAYAGTTGRACDPATDRISGVVTDGSGAALSGAHVDVSNDGTTVSTVTDDNGLFSVGTPAGTLPDSYVVNVYDGEHVPVGVPVTKSPDGVDTLGDVALVDSSDEEVPFELTPVVHHLGDGMFSGMENSMLQFPNAESVSRSYEFTIADAHLAHASASFSLMAKGVNCADEVSINGQVVGTLERTPGDGSYAALRLAVPMAVLQLGANTATIASVTCDGSDYDDFEYSVPGLKFE